MPKLRELTLISLLTIVVLLACTPSGDLDIYSVGILDISVEDATAATVKSMSIESAVEATLQAMAPEATETPTPQPIGQVPTPNNALVSNPTVVIESVATSAVTATTGAVTSTATVVIEVAAPTSIVTSGLVSSLATPVVQVATPTSIVSASIETVTATAAVTPTNVPGPVPLPTATVVSTPVPLPTATVVSTPVPLPTATATPQPVKIKFREGIVPIPTSFEYFEIQSFRVENIKELNASGVVSASVKWGDSNEWFGVPIDVETGDIIAGHIYQLGGYYDVDLKITSESGDLFLHSFSVFVNGPVSATPTPTPVPPTPTPTYDELFPAWEQRTDQIGPTLISVTKVGSLIRVQFDEALSLYSLNPNDFGLRLKWTERSGELATGAYIPASIDTSQASFGIVILTIFPPPPPSEPWEIENFFIEGIYDLAGNRYSP
jgi:hypothetical protein